MRKEWLPCMQRPAKCRRDDRPERRSHSRGQTASGSLAIGCSGAGSLLLGALAIKPRCHRIGMSGVTFHINDSDLLFNKDVHKHNNSIICHKWWGNLPDQLPDVMVI